MCLDTSFRNDSEVMGNDSCWEGICLVKICSETLRGTIDGSSSHIDDIARLQDRIVLPFPLIGFDWIGPTKVRIMS